MRKQRKILKNSITSRFPTKCDFSFYLNVTKTFVRNLIIIFKKHIDDKMVENISSTTNSKILSYKLCRIRVRRGENLATELISKWNKCMFHPV